MRYTFKEYSKTDYSNYKYPYLVYGELEDNENFSQAYNRGFLMSRIKNNYLYLARSLRVNLKGFEFNSENRRINRKTEYLEAELIKLGDFEYSYQIGKFGQDFYKERFGEKKVSAQKIKWLFTESDFTHVIKYTDKTSNSNEAIGYCIVLVDNDMMHYAYPFYKTEYYEKNIGLGMILKAIDISIENKLSKFYLGTIYTESSKYKLQFENLEWFDGESWSNDLDKLKEKIDTNSN
jgi:arginyl-tRNA--protein-N-Asp/Glu arginylyltransferase